MWRATFHRLGNFLLCTFSWITNSRVKWHCAASALRYVSPHLRDAHWKTDENLFVVSEKQSNWLRQPSFVFWVSSLISPKGLRNQESNTRVLRLHQKYSWNEKVPGNGTEENELTAQARPDIRVQLFDTGTRKSSHGFGANCSASLVFFRRLQSNPDIQQTRNMRNRTVEAKLVLDCMEC